MSKRILLIFESGLTEIGKCREVWNVHSDQPKIPFKVRNDTNEKTLKATKASVVVERKNEFELDGVATVLLYVYCGSGPQQQITGL